MSQQPKSNAGKASKRKTGAVVAQSQGGALGAGERTMRQRTDQAAVVRFAPAAAASLSATPLAPNACFMRLAVVERQLIVQLLDIKSLAKVASTCAQLREEAMHKEAGKFIHAPENPHDREDCCIALELDPRVNESRLAPFSPLFRRHMPMTLVLMNSADELMDLDEVDLVLRKADQFTRIAYMIVPSEFDFIWPESFILGLLQRPCIQRVEIIRLAAASWMTHPRVQAALFALPCLKSLTVTEGPPPLKSAIVQARSLTSLDLSVTPAYSRLLRPIRHAPALTDLSLSTEAGAIGISLAGVVWCLPATITRLKLGSFDVSEAAASRSLLKAMFLRVPSLQSFSAWEMQVVPLIQGMLDAGVQSLPMLRHVSFDSLKGTLDPALLRRFLHRFPAVDVIMSLLYYHDMTQSKAAFGRTFGGWPRVRLAKDVAENDGPPVPNKDDGMDGPNIDAAVDPGSDEE